mmetsp:Transcript_36064/g.72344  ORF Transcript_36064/g.72344 Transcript_36064/m.72344 type:complete len:200 (+) Transcript_36064:1088-1687(+)
MRQLSASTCCIWMVLTSVQRPCRMMSMVLLMEGSFEVKGAATDASPSLTIGTSPVSTSASIAACAVNALDPPRAAVRAALRLLISSCVSAIACFIALTTTQLSPLRVISSWMTWYRSICIFFISSWSFLTSSLIFFCLSCRALNSFIWRAFFSASLSWSLVLSPSLAVLAPPNPLSNARPTCACFSAPTSLAPSPHINV